MVEHVLDYQVNWFGNWLRAAMNTCSTVVLPWILLRPFLKLEDIWILIEVNNLSASFKPVHDRHVKIKQYEINFVLISLDILKDLQSIHSLSLDVDVKWPQIVSNCHQLEMVIVGYKALDLRSLKKNKISKKYLRRLVSRYHCLKTFQTKVLVRMGLRDEQCSLW